MVGGNQRSQSNYAQNIAKSMTIDEMRQLHQRALSEAEAKQTELRLVLASRYRELVGSSDEVTKMRERAQELHELVHALPTLMSKLVESSKSLETTELEGNVQDKDATSSTQQDSKSVESSEDILSLRHELALLPRIIHRALDKDDVHDATESLMSLFRLIAEQTDEYPLATALAQDAKRPPSKKLDSLLQAQMRMVFLHVQTLPARITRISMNILRASASYGLEGWDPSFGAQTSAAALSSLNLLDVNTKHDRIVQLLDLYFNSKAELLKSLLSKLTTSGSGTGSSSREEPASDGGAHNAEAILSKIVLILQYDVIVHPYEIFILRNFPCSPKLSTTSDEIMKTLPIFPAEIVQAKASTLLAAHLPLIRTKVKSVLVDIAGTTASALGKIRQSLYDKTDGIDSMERLDKGSVCTWEQAVHGMVDFHTVLSSGHRGVGGTPVAFSESTSSLQGDSANASSLEQNRKFSLWGVLFSNTFSSLVHSLLTSSFHSVHAKVVSSLRLSLANAPPLSALLPHEAYRNTLHIASELDAALLKVSDDAHELLVHAEERVESERRLRQSLYVQTCEIMGRLICELRRMLSLQSQREGSDVGSQDAVKELIVGRLCHLLKFRLTGLPTLLNPSSSPAVLHGTSGMISLLELSSAFELADDDDDGLITFEEAMEAVESAFSGTQFHGAEMIRETLLLSSNGDKDKITITSTGSASASGSAPHTPQDVTLNELVLLSSRGLRHEATGRHSALGTIQNSLDNMIERCFNQWARAGLNPPITTMSSKIEEFVTLASSSSEVEYRRIHNAEGQPYAASGVLSTAPSLGNVSSYVVAYLLETANLLNRSICPSDSLMPVPSTEYASSMGIIGDKIPSVMDVIRWALLSQSLSAMVSVLSKLLKPALDSHLSSSDVNQVSLRGSGPSSLLQLKNDLSFVLKCFFDRNKHGFGAQWYTNDPVHGYETSLKDLINKTNGLLGSYSDAGKLLEIEEKHRHVFDVCALFLAPLLGEDEEVAVGVSSLSGFDSLDPAGATGLRGGANPLLDPPLQSSCRFPLLPVQADRTLSDVQLRGKYNDNKVETDHRQDTGSGGVMSSGLGFFSSILKTN